MTRYYKTRSLASEACKKNHVKINDSAVKPAKEVYTGEKVVIRKQQINYEILVLDLPKNRVGAKLVDLYRKDITPAEAFEKLELIRSAQNYYHKKGTGRPTKKDRRDIEDYNEDQQ
jgi:ribosome-associated heat shock protein Hsp15